MKRIGTLNNIPIVEGDANELKINNILYDKKEDGIELFKRGDDGEVHSITSGSSSLFKYYEIPDANSPDSNESTFYTLTILSNLPVFSVIYVDTESLSYKLVNNFSCTNNSASNDSIKTALVSPLFKYGDGNSPIGNLSKVKGVCLYTGKQITGIISAKTESPKFIELEGDLVSYFSAVVTTTSGSINIEEIKSMISQSNIKEISEKEYLDLLNQTVVHPDV